MGLCCSQLEASHLELRSRRPFTGVLFGESPKVLWRVLSECFLGIPKKCPGECPRECLENWECPRECSGECLSSFFPKEKHSWEHSLHCQFSRHSRGHSPGHFLGIPKKHSESTRRSTFCDSPRIGANFREGEEDSNFSVFRVRRITESPGPLH